MRLRKKRLVAPITALNPNRTVNRHGRGSAPRQKAASTKLKKLAVFTQVASPARSVPRTPAGTAGGIHGSHAALEMPRERLKPKSSARIRASCEGGLRKP